MRSKILWLVLALALSGPGAACELAAPAADLVPQPVQARAARLAATVMKDNHYQNQPLDDALSQRMFEAYLKQLDPEKFIFTQADIDALAPIRTQLDDAVAEADLGIPFGLFSLYVKRAAERYAYACSLLGERLDFREDETLPTRRSKGPWARSEEEIRDLWRRRVKNDWLQMRLGGKDDRTIAETLERRYSSQIKRLGRLDADKAFQTFMNAYTMAVEPHTNYLGQRASENFDISMKLSLVGIGAVLEDKDGYATIREVIPGSPAALSGQIRVGDRIVGISQGNGITDVVGWGLDDTVSLIRGKPDSTVTLEILPAATSPDGKERLVSLVRKKVSLVEQAARKSVVTLKDGDGVRRIGVITLPTFYEDFGARQSGDPDYRSAARDVERLLGELKAQGVESILMDLRNNGGGSLREAIELTGLFIDHGPVVQERNARGRIMVDEDTRPGTAWDGPLAVLINRSSASASEIFSAAIQDYGRGIILGERSYGKGTVQSLMNLDRMARNDKPEYGTLKLTISQFFRIDGSTTQLQGVTPDIPFPAVSDDESVGESALDNPLPATRIPAAAYGKVADIAPLVPLLVAKHELRMAADADLKQLARDIAEIREKRSQRAVSLNEAARRAEREKAQARLAALKPRPDVAIEKDGPERGAGLSGDGVEDPSPSAEPDDPLEDLGLGANRKKDGRRDLFLIEAARVAADQAALMAKGTAASVTRLPGQAGG